jgi:hypothetical protein
LAADFELMARLLDRFKVKSIYTPRISTRMRLGGATNNSIGNIIQQNREIYRACKQNEIQFSLALFLASKIVSRTKQFCVKPGT